MLQNAPQFIQRFLTLDEVSVQLMSVFFILATINSVLLIWNLLRNNGASTSRKGSRFNKFTGRVMEVVSGLCLCFGIAYVGFGVMPYWPFWSRWIAWRLNGLSPG